MPGSPDPTYLIDANCLIGLEDCHDRVVGQPVIILFQPSERKKVWQGLRDLSKNGRLKIVAEVRAEIAFRCKSAKELISRCLTKTGSRKSRAIMVDYQRIIRLYPGWAPNENTQFDSADPWLIATASVRNYVVVTDELPAFAQARMPSRNRHKIPDVCAREGLVCQVGLKELARQQGWI